MEEIKPENKKVIMTAGSYKEEFVIKAMVRIVQMKKQIKSLKKKMEVKGKNLHREKRLGGIIQSERRGRFPVKVNQKEASI